MDMKKLHALSATAVAAMFAACTCPSTFREVPAPGRVTTVEQVNALSRCQVKLYGTTLLAHAESVPLVRALVSRGAEPNGRLIIGGREYYGSAMLLADNAGVVRALGAAGCDPNIQGGQDNAVPLCNAIRSGRPDLAEALLAVGADPNRTDSYCETPLFLAASALDARMCRLLIAKGAKVDVGRSSDGSTPLIAALSAGGSPDASLATKMEVAGILLSAGAKATQADAAGTQPVHWAPLELLPTLISAGADVNAVNSQGRTPLFFGGGRSRGEFLLERGVDINARDISGYTAFDAVPEAAFKSYLLSCGGRSGKAL